MLKLRRVRYSEKEKYDVAMEYAHGYALVVVEINDEKRRLPADYNILAFELLPQIEAMARKILEKDFVDILPEVSCLILIVTKEIARTKRFRTFRLWLESLTLDTTEELI